MNIRNKLVFVADMPFQPSLMFVGRQGAYSRVQRLKGDSLG
jgi:hypothetical protein